LFSVSGNDWIDAKPIASTGRTWKLSEKSTLDLFHFEYTYSKLEYLSNHTLLREDHIVRFSDWQE